MILNSEFESLFRGIYLKETKGGMSLEYIRPHIEKKTMMIAPGGYENNEFEFLLLRDHLHVSEHKIHMLYCKQYNRNLNN